MIQINNINFSQKTIESIQIDSNDVKGVEVELLDNNFKLTIIKNTNEIIKEDINDSPPGGGSLRQKTKHIDYIHNEPEQDEPNEEPKEEEPEPEQEPKEEPEPEQQPEPDETIDTGITLEKFKDI